LAAAVGCRAATDYRQLFGLADAAVVAVPTERHREVAGACLEAGLHVLVEKPIARSLVEAAELNALARDRHLVFHVGHVERYNPAFRALCARAPCPLYMEAERLSTFNGRVCDVDVVLDLMVHDLDLALVLAGDEVAGVTACGFSVLTGSVDIANARIEFARGCIANLSASRVSQAAVRKFRVFGADGYVSADLRSGRLRCVTRSGGDLAQQEEAHGGADALSAQAKAFVHAIDGEPGGVDGESAARALRLALEVETLVHQRLERFHHSQAAR
ncbi:MAG TPA: Gfo/Idh/MocA family oxidoreductase, partial [Myxococcota bacterium]|nr:Gfo/Idh/MocA family oxidoreductase [Myxococcota bacterium]